MEFKIEKELFLKSLQKIQGIVEKDKININLSGIASSYDVLSKQSDAFGSPKLNILISRPVISDFNPLADGGIAFNFSASVYSKLITAAEVGQDTSAPVMNTGSNATTTNQ